MKPYYVYKGKKYAHLSLSEKVYSCVNMIKWCLVALVFVAYNIQSSNEQAPTPCGSDVNNRLIARNVIFTRQLFYDAFKNNNGVSFSICPFGVLFSIALLALYTTGTSKNQLTSFMNVTDLAQIRCIFPYYLVVFNEQQKYIDSLLYAKFYVAQNIPVTGTFQNDSLNILGYKSDNIDFSNTASAATNMSNWMKQASHNRIPNIVKSSMITTKELMVLLNGVPFSGGWARGFNPAYSFDQKFYVNSSKTITRRYMYKVDKINYTESSTLKSKIIQMPFKNSNLSCVVILPNSKDALEPIIQQLKDPATLKNVMASFTLQNVAVTLPTCNINTTLNLIPYLKSYGITDVFDQNKANFNGVSSSSSKLAVTTGLHALNFKITEEGDTYASVGSATKTFNANQTFIYIIILLNDVKFCAVDAG